MRKAGLIMPIELHVVRKRERAAFTLIELVVLLVVVSLVFGALLPLLERAREEERKTRCRSNLRQIGLAIVMYCASNGGWTPEFAGSMYNSEGGANTCIGYARGGMPNEKARFIGSWQNINAVFSNQVTTAEVQIWNCTPAAPARAMSVGLLWFRGYLTGKGAEVLYCPSDSSSAWAVENGRNRMRQYDADEPFWTSKGAVIRSDGDGTGDIGSRAFGNYLRCWDGSGYTATNECAVLTNYSARVLEGNLQYMPTSSNGWLPTAVKKADAARKALLGDMIEFWQGSMKDPAGARNNAPPPGETEAERTAYLAKHMAANHDGAYNLLFGDGSVKTLSDGSNMALKLVARQWLAQFCEHYASGVYMGHNPSYPSAEGADEGIWTPLFDEAYPPN